MSPSDEWIPGDPNAPSRERVQAAPGEPAREPADHAPGDEMLGMPSQPPADVRPARAEENLFAQEAQRQAEADLEQALLDKTRPPAWASYWPPRWLAPLITLAAAGLLLFLLVQGAAFVDQLQRLAPPLRYAGYALLGVLAALMVWALARLGWTVLRLKTTPRLQIKALRELAQRSELRTQVARRLGEAQQQLRQFLRDYPLEDRSARRGLTQLGFTGDEADALARVRRSLLEQESAGSEDWIEQFDHHFLAVLDAAARRRVALYAKLVGLKTAALPSGFADSAVVVLNAHLMAGDLCRIYNLRTSGPGTWAVLWRIFVNAFAASQISQWSDSAADGFMDAAETGTGILAGAAKAVLSRAAEGGANYLLFRRLGSAAVRYLRPVWPPL